MNCSEVQRILPEIIDDAQNQDALDLELRSHLKTCPDCSELVSDLKWIAGESRELAATEEPPARVWVRIAAELRAEGIIREPEVVTGAGPARPVLVPAPSRRWSVWWLAPVAVAILAAGSYLLNHSATPSQVAKQNTVQQPNAHQAATQVAQQKETQSTVAQQPAMRQPAAQPSPDLVAKARPSVPDHPPAEAADTAEEAEVSAPPAAEDAQFLSEVSQRAPSMRATYESQLQAVNNEIRETQVYIKRHPDDPDARQHLMETYQQKAMLYQMALDRIQ